MDNQGQGPPLSPTNGTAPDGSAASGADAAPDDAGIKMVLPNISFSMGQPTIGATGGPPGGVPPGGPSPHGGPTPALPPYPPPSNEGYPPSGGGYPPDSAPRSTGLGALGIGGDGGDMRGDTRGEHGEHRQKRSAGEMYGGEPGDSAWGGERGERGERGGGPGGERGGGSGEQKRWPGWPGDNVFRFVVPMGKVGSIIGRRGEYVKKICDETKARVKIVEGAPGTDDRVVLVSGREDPDLELPPAVVAMMRVHRRIVEGVSEDDIEASQPGEGFRGQVATRLLVPATQAGSLIGRQGQTIKALQDSTGAHIRILSLEDVPPCALEDDRVVEVTGEYACVHEAVKGVTLHLRRFLCDHSVLPLFEQCRSFPPPMDPRGAPYSSPSGHGGGWGNPPPGGMHSPPHRSRFDLPPSAAPDPYGSLSSLGSMGGADRYGSAMGGLGAGGPAAGPGGGMDASGQLRAALSKYGRETPAAAAAAAMTNTVSPVVTQVSATMQIPLSYVDAIIGPNGTNIVFLRRTSGAAVTIQESRGAGGQPEMTVEVRGSATQVQTAQQLIEGFMNSHTGYAEPAPAPAPSASAYGSAAASAPAYGSAPTDLSGYGSSLYPPSSAGGGAGTGALQGVVLGLAGHMGHQEEMGDDRPSDEAILAQQNAMREQEAQWYPLVGEKEPLSALASEYAAGSTAFQDKIEHLAAEYEAIRRTRGDGNCFFRCFLFALLEHLLQGGSKEECAQVRERVARSEQRLRDLGYTEFTWEDFAAEYRELLYAVDPSSAAEKTTVDGLLKRCQDPDCSNYAVMFLRFITSADIQHRADFFHPFLPDAAAAVGGPKEAAKLFCHKAVEPMGEESDHVHVTAITDALAVPIRIVYLDRSAGQANFHEFLPEESVQATPAMTLLYRPGHYDILYPKQK
ncbi:unnamed protein product [Closterium sp. Naga37s-1]|nr:unnamed protein product [Closterium sp. Naga37s-1]